MRFGNNVFEAAFASRVLAEGEFAELRKHICFATGRFLMRMLSNNRSRIYTYIFVSVFLTHFYFVPNAMIQQGEEGRRLPAQGEKGKEGRLAQGEEGRVRTALEDYPQSNLISDDAANGWNSPHCSARCGGRPLQYQRLLFLNRPLSKLLSLSLSIIVTFACGGNLQVSEGCQKGGPHPGEPEGEGRRGPRLICFRPLARPPQLSIFHTVDKRVREFFPPRRATFVQRNSDRRFF